MADKNLNSITFPGLPDKYKVAQVADEYSSSSTYDVGDIVNYLGTTYRCTTAITTAENWTAGHWTPIKIADEVTDLKSAIGNKSNLNTDTKTNLVSAINEVNGHFLDGIDTAVENWLDNHPEATTTVQDGSLTYAKLVTGTLGFVTPQMYGAKGDGETDDTEAIQQCFDENDFVYFPEGTYLVDSYRPGGVNYIGINSGVAVHSNMTIVFSGNAKLKSTVNRSGCYDVLVIRDVKNVRIVGGIIEGDKTTPTESPFGSEYGFGITVWHSENIIIDCVEIYNCWGDGIYLDANYVDGDNRNVVIHNCHIHDCRRQGISLCRGKKCIIDSVYIHDISGSDPQGCIDIEGAGTVNIEDIHIVNSVLDNGNKIACAVSNNATRIIISNCKIGLLKLYTLISCSVNNCYIDQCSVAQGECELSNCVINGYLNLFYYSLNVKFFNCIFHGYNNSERGAAIIMNSGENNNYIDAEFFNCTFDLPTYLDDGETTAIDFIKNALYFNDGHIKYVFKNCELNLGSRGNFVYQNFGKLMKMELIGTKIKTNASVSGGIFSGPRDLIIKNSVLEFTNSVTNLCIINYSDSPIKFNFEHNTVIGNLTRMMYNTESGGYATPCSIIIHDNIFKNSNSTVRDGISPSTTASNVTVVGGTNYACPLDS